MANEGTGKLSPNLSNIKKNQWGNRINHLSFTNIPIKIFNESIARIYNNQETISEKIIVIKKKLGKTLFDFIGGGEIRYATDHLKID